MLVGVSYSIKIDTLSNTLVRQIDKFIVLMF